MVGRVGSQVERLRQGPLERHPHDHRKGQLHERETRQVKARTSLVAVIKLGSAVLATALGYALFATLYNSLVAVDRQLEVVTGAIHVAIVGTATLVAAWIYQRDRRERGQ